MPSLSNNDLTLTIKAIDNASKELKQVRDKVDDLGGSADKTSALSERLSGAVSKVAGIAKAAALAVGTLTAAVGTAGLTIGIGFNSSVEQAQAKLMAFMKDGAKVAATLSWVKQEAAATQFSFTDMADAAANLTPVAKTSGKSLESLVRQAEILAALNPTEGLTGATFSLREALSGDWVSIVDRFNLPRQRINELKAQGVPAMEIISKTLNEMGIDYGLVAAQGKTLSARFDQVKDKLTMMAGAATKPIFDRISKEFDKVGQIDFEGWGNRAATAITDLINLMDRLWPAVQAVAKQVGDYLAPKMQGLWNSVRDNLIPILERLWKNVIEPLLPVLGAAFVGAIGGVTDALKIVVDWIGWFADELEAGNPFIWIVVGALGALAGALALNAAFATVTALFTTLTTVTIPAATAAFGGFAAMLSIPLVMPAIAVGAALAAIASVMDAYGRMQEAIEGAKSAQKEYQRISWEANNALIRAVQAGEGPASPELKAKADQARATLRKWGVQGFSDGGFTGRGAVNEVAGVVHKGEYVVPKHQVDQSTGRPKAPAGASIRVTQHIYNQLDYDKGITKLGFMLRGAAA